LVIVGWCLTALSAQNVLDCTMVVSSMSRRGRQ